MTVTLVSFATKPFVLSQNRLVESARKMGISSFKSFTEDMLKRTEFYHKHQSTFCKPRGFGYWLWKPFFIQQALNEATSGDYVFYADCGAEFTHPVDALIQIADTQEILLFNTPGRLNRYWTKRDCLILMDCDSEKYYDGANLTASFQIYKKGEKALAFAAEYLKYCENPDILGDAPSSRGEELAEFIDHRHDQSVLSLLAIKRGLQVFRDPSQWGNHGKLPEFRVPNEPLMAPYCPDPISNSHYPTLINHHREHVGHAPSLLHRAYSAAKRRLRRGKYLRDRAAEVEAQFPASHLTPIIKKNRKCLNSVSSWVSEDSLAASQFHYGVPDKVYPLLNRSIDESPTYSDCMLYLSQHLLKQLNYLEIGVSVGKNLFQIMNNRRDSAITGFDIEEINPILESYLQPAGVDAWEAHSRSAKRGGRSSLKTYKPDANNNTIRYLSGDVFDETCWERLKGQRFNCIFSDALHWPEGLVVEFNMIMKYDLLDRDAYLLVWDDLGDVMTAGFESIWRRLLKQEGAARLRRLLLPLNGWLGQHEAKHLIGFIVKLPEDVPLPPSAFLERNDGRQAVR